MHSTLYLLGEDRTHNTDIAQKIHHEGHTLTDHATEERLFVKIHNIKLTLAETSTFRIFNFSKYPKNGGIEIYVMFICK